MLAPPPALLAETVQVREAVDRLRGEISITGGVVSIANVPRRQRLISAMSGRGALCEATDPDAVELVAAIAVDDEKGAAARDVTRFERVVEDKDNDEDDDDDDDDMHEDGTVAMGVKGSFKWELEPGAGAADMGSALLTFEAHPESISACFTSHLCWRGRPCFACLPRNRHVGGRGAGTRC